MATFYVRLVLAALFILVPGASGEFVTQKDRVVQTDAKKARDEICSRVEDVHIDAELGRDEIQEALGGDNFVLTAMQEETNSTALQKRLQKEVVEPGFIIKAAYPILIAVITLIVYLICFWTACPCCKCCRVNKIVKSGPHSRRCKGIFSIALVVCLGGILGGGITTMVGYRKALTGFDLLQCQAATVLETTLSGATEPYFIGILPIMETIQNISDNLNNGSQMMTELQGIIASTEIVQESVFLTSSVLEVLSETLAKPANMNPATASTGDLFHECTLCQDLSDTMSSVSMELTSGVASAMSAARASLKDSLSAEKRAEMQQSLASSSDNLLNFKNKMRDTFAEFVKEEGTFDWIHYFLVIELQAIINVIFYWGLLLFCCGCCSWGCWVKSESRSGDNDFYRCPHRCACCVWLIAFIPIFVGLIVAGLFMVISVPLSSVCDIMDKFDSNMLTDIAPSFEFDLSGDSGEMFSDMVGQCLVPADPSVNANMMKIVFTVTNGTKESVYDTTSRIMMDPISQAFKSLDDAMAASPTSALAASQPVTSLRTMLSANPMSVFYLPVMSKLQGDSANRFDAMLADASLAAAAVTSCMCADHTPVGTASNVSIPGIASFNALMDSVATGTSTGPDCFKLYTCSSNTAACDGGRTLMSLKREMYFPGAPFKCVRFLKTDDTPCDMKTMVKDGSGVWQNDCISTMPDGTKMVKREWYDCDLVAFDQNIADFDVLLDLAFSRLDATANAFTGTVGTDMKHLAMTYLVDPAMSILTGVTCGFMAKFYRGVVDGMCFSGVYGIRVVGKSYLVLCFFIAFLAITVYWLWRRALDNVNAQTEQKKESIV